jgi:hypothetical protein
MNPFGWLPTAVRRFDARRADARSSSISRWAVPAEGATTRDCRPERICQIYGFPRSVYAGAIRAVKDEFLFIFQKGIGAAIE